MIYDIQKAKILKRISAFLLDAILFCVLAVGFAALISWISGFDGYFNDYQLGMEEYQAIYDTNDLLDDEAVDAMTDAERDIYTALTGEISQNFGMMMSLMLVMVSIGLLLSALILEFILPLVFKNGQTIGKKVFSICVAHQNGVRVNTVTMFIRAILGKYAVEIMVPALLIMMVLFGVINFIGIIVLALLVVLEIGLVIGTKTDSFIHDVFAQTVVVDIDTQMLFDTEQDLLEYKKSLALNTADTSGAYDKSLFENKSSALAPTVEQTAVDTQEVPTTFDFTAEETDKHFDNNINEKNE